MFILLLCTAVSQESLPSIGPEAADIDVGEGRTIVDALLLLLLDPEKEIVSEPESLQEIGEEKATAETAGKPDEYERGWSLACLFRA